MRLIVKGKSINLPGSGRKFRLLVPGSEFPEGALPPAEVDRLRALGILVEAEAPVVPGKLPVRLGKWCMDPKELAGKSVQDLLLMVQQIDAETAEDLEPSVTEADLVRLLTSDFDPLFARPAAPVSADVHRPAEPALRRARDRARGER